MSANDHTHDATDHTITTASAELRAHVSTSDDGTTECTLYPAQVPEERWTTTWISAKEGSFVDLASHR
jgi:hypothetical protein